MQAIVDAFESGQLPGRVVLLISNNSGSGAMERARRHNIPRLHLSGVTHPDPQQLDRVMVSALEESGANLVCLAGYMKKLGPETLEKFQGRMLNVHPSLLPRHGGKGMYGQRVHRSVLASGDTVTGVTIHLVEGDYDQGPVLAQKEIRVLPDDDVATLSRRVLEVEHQLYVEVLGSIARGELHLPALPGD